VRVRDQRHERRPGGGVLPAEADQPGARLVLCEIRGSRVGDRGEQRADIGAVAPETRDPIQIRALHACGADRVCERGRERPHRNAEVEDERDGQRAADALAEVEERRERRILGRLRPLELGREHDAGPLRRRDDLFERGGGDADVEPDQGEAEPGGHVDLREERLDALVHGHRAVTPAEQVDVAPDRRRLEPEPIAETAEAEDVLRR
jgi:hypothetical protein